MPSKQEYQELFKALLAKAKSYRVASPDDQTRFMNAVSMLYLLMGELAQSAASGRLTRPERNIAAHANAQASNSGDHNFDGFVEYMEDYLVRQRDQGGGASGSHGSGVRDHLTDVDAIELMLDVLRLIPNAAEFRRILAAPMDDLANRIAALHVYYSLLRLGELPYITVDGDGKPLVEATLRFSEAIEQPEIQYFFELLSYFRQLRHHIAHSDDDLMLNQSLREIQDQVLNRLEQLKAELPQLLLSGVISRNKLAVSEANRFSLLADLNNDIEEDGADYNKLSNMTDNIIALYLDESRVLGGEETCQKVSKRARSSIEYRRAAALCLLLAFSLPEVHYKDIQAVVKKVSDLCSIQFNSNAAACILGLSAFFRFPKTLLNYLWINFFSSLNSEGLFYKSVLYALLETPCEQQRDEIFTWSLQKCLKKGKLSEFHRYLVMQLQQVKNTIQVRSQEANHRMEFACQWVQDANRLSALIFEIENMHIKKLSACAFDILFQMDHDLLLTWITDPRFNPNTRALKGHYRGAPIFHLAALIGEQPDYGKKNTKLIYEALLARDDLDPNILDHWKHSLLARLIFGHNIVLDEGETLMDYLELLLCNEHVNLNPRILFPSKAGGSSKNPSNKAQTLAFRLIFLTVSKDAKSPDPAAVERFARLADTIIVKLQSQGATSEDKKVLTTFVTCQVSLVIKGIGLDRSSFSIENAAHSQMFGQRLPDYHQLFFRATVAYYEAELRVLDSLLNHPKVPIIPLLRKGYEKKKADFMTKLSSLMDKFPASEVSLDPAARAVAVRRSESQ